MRVFIDADYELNKQKARNRRNNMADQNLSIFA